MSGKLIMTKGLPASGKSTWAAEQAIQSTTRFVIVSKDDIRLEMAQDWSRDVEKEVLRIRDFRICEALNKGRTVISSDTNLAPKHEQTLRAIAKRYKADFEIKDFTDISVEECIKRDSVREAKVGEKVIKDMAAQYLGYKIPDPLQDVVKYVPKDRTTRAIICDLDGTLCLHDGRSPYDTSLCFSDKINYPILEILQQSNTYKIIYCSGREEKFRDMSKNWLDTAGAPIGKLFMRPTGDTRNDAIVKLEIFNSEIRDVYNVRFVLDDRDRVVKMWRSLGLTCLQVAYGDF